MRLRSPVSLEGGLLGGVEGGDGWMADKVHATAASPKASWGLGSGAQQRRKQQMGGIRGTSLSFTVPDIFTGTYLDLLLLLYKRKYNVMKK